MNLQLEERLHVDQEEITEIIRAQIEGYHEVLDGPTQVVIYEITREVLREYLSRGWIRMTMHPIKSIQKVYIDGQETPLL